MNDIIRNTYNFLDEKYPTEEYRHNFPSVKTAIEEVVQTGLSGEELQKIIDTFAFHEIGYIPDEYVEALHCLQKKFVLSVVIDIWAPKKLWLETFQKRNIDHLFAASSFSSDHGMVKPSSKPFEMVMSKLEINREDACVIGDSVRRDLGGARAAGIDCILVGGEKNTDACGTFENLLELCDVLSQKLIENSGGLSRGK